MNASNCMRRKKKRPFFFFHRKTDVNQILLFYFSSILPRNAQRYALHCKKRGQESIEIRRLVALVGLTDVTVMSNCLGPTAEIILYYIFLSPVCVYVPHAFTTTRCIPWSAEPATEAAASMCMRGRSCLCELGKPHLRNKYFF